jgi:response regulator RpfG family c-di-GMP phosphodiesterase
MKTNAREKDDFILFVDDEENILRSLKRELLDIPYGLLTASSATEALELMRTFPISVLISDQRMPGTSGTELLAIAREQYPDTVRNMLTAFSDMQDIIDVINKAGIHKFIQKPWKTEELKKMIAEAVDYYHVKREKNCKKQIVKYVDGMNHTCAVYDYDGSIEKHCIQMYGQSVTEFAKKMM